MCSRYTRPRPFPECWNPHSCLAPFQIKGYDYAFEKSIVSKCTLYHSLLSCLSHIHTSRHRNGSRKRKASLAHDDDSPTELTSSSSSSLSSTASWYWPTTQQQQQQQLKQQHAYLPANKASRRLSMDLPWPASSQPTRRSWSFSVQRDEPVRLPPIRNIMSPPPPSTTPSSSIATPTQPPPPIQQSQQPPPPPQPVHPTTVANGTPSANGAGDIIEVDAAVAMMQLASPQHSMVHLSSTAAHHHHHHHQRIQKHSAVW